MIKDILRRRGFVPVELNESAQTLCPADGDAASRFRELFERKSVRKMLRSLTQSKQMRRDDLAATAGTPGAAIQKRIDELAQLGVIQLALDGYVSLAKPVDNIGPTLEWCLARTVENELAGSAAWGVTLKGVTVGGDFDVIAWLDPLLVYIETKTGRPESISNEELAYFLQRAEELAPDIHILLVDTDEDLGGLVERMCLQVMLEPLRLATGPSIPPGWRPQPHEMFIQPVKGSDELFFGGRARYLTNSKKGLVEPLRQCIRHFNQVARHLVIPSGDPIVWAAPKRGSETSGDEELES